MSTKANSLTIGLMGPFGYGNLGDAASLEAMIYHIRARFPNAHIYGFSLNPADIEQRHGIAGFPVSRMVRQEATDDRRPLARLKNWLTSHPNPGLRQLERWVSRLPLELGLATAAYRNLHGLDMLIVCGGGQLQDYWMGGGPWSYPYTLLKFGLLSRLRGVDFSFVSVGAGPVDAPLSRLFIRWALSLAKYRSYRDEYSRTYIADIVGFKADDPVYPDLAFSLQRTGRPERLRRPSGPLVGIGPIGFFRPGCWPEANADRYADYLSKMVEFVAWLVRRGRAVTFLPGEAHYDRLVIDDLLQRLRADGLSGDGGQIVDIPVKTTAELVDLLAATDLICASRFHNLVLAQMLGRPGLAISYQAKIDALMTETGQGDYCLPIATFTLDTLKERFLALEANSQIARQQIASHMAACQSVLEEQYARIYGDR